MTEVNFIQILGLDYRDPKKKVLWLRIKTDDGVEDFTAILNEEYKRLQELGESPT